MTPSSGRRWRPELPDIAWEWISHVAGDLLAGAAQPGAIDIANPDVIVVGGTNIKTAYLNALRWLESSGTTKPLSLVGKNFEFCGSSLPIPAQVEAAGHLSLPPLRRLLPHQGPAAGAGDQQRSAAPA